MQNSHVKLKRQYQDKNNCGFAANEIAKPMFDLRNQVNKKYNSPNYLILLY